MTISVKCPGCGRTFQAPDGLADKRLKCPKCSAVIEVGAQTPPPSGQVASAGDSPEAIPVTCACGKAFRAKAALAGKQVKCPACGQALMIPERHPAAETAPAAMDFDAMMAADAAAETSPGAPLGPPRPSRRKASGSRTRLIVGLGVGVSVVAVVLVAAMLLRPGGDNGELASDGATPGVQPVAAPQSPVSPPPAPSVATGERTYPSFPDALTEPPAWLGPDVPFDVEEFFAAPPPDENAAPLYLDALFEFSEEMAPCFCPSGEEPRGAVKRRAEAAAQRAEKRAGFDRVWDMDPHSLDAPALQVWLAEYETGFEKLAIAQQRPECVFEGGMSATSSVGHGLAGREVSRVVVWRARRSVALRDLERPLRDIETTLRLSRDLQPRGGMIGQLISIDMDNRCCQDVVQLCVYSDGFSERHCDRLLGVLSEHEARSHRRFVEAIRGEYICGRKLLYDLQHRSGDLDPQFLGDSGVDVAIDSPLACLQQLVVLDSAGTWRLSEEKYGKGGDRLPPDHPLVAGWMVDGKLMTVDAYSKEVDAMNRVYATILDSANQTTLQQLQLSRDPTVIAPLRETEVALFLEPPWRLFPLSSLRAETELQGTMCQIALRRWQLDHDGPPPDLETVVKAAGMSAVPIDPYSDRPMRMTIIDGRPVVYSIGLDGKDDRGLVEWDFDPEDPHGDVLFPLPVAR